MHRNKRHNKIRGILELGSWALEDDCWGLSSTYFVTTDNSFIQASVPSLLKKKRSIIISILQDYDKD